jgi:argininosuccinate lyase
MVQLACSNCYTLQHTKSHAEGLDPVMEQYNASLPYDRLFYAEDIAGSIAFARANKENGILTAEEFAAIEQGLAQIKQEWASRPTTKTSTRRTSEG